MLAINSGGLWKSKARPAPLFARIFIHRFYLVSPSKTDPNKGAG